MDYVKLGNSDLRVSRICLGCMGFGDPTIGQHSWTIGDRYGVEMTQISLAWLLTKVESPIVGATKLHHIEGAVKSLDVRLTADDIHYLEEPYVPHNLSGVMAVNKPVMNEEPVWVAASRNK